MQKLQSFWSGVALRCQSSCQMICLFSSPLWMISSQELRSLSCSHDSAATCAVLQASRSCVEPATCEVPYYDYGSLLASRDEWVNLGGPGMGDPWPWLSRCAASGDRARSSKAEYAGAVQLHVWDFTVYPRLRKHRFVQTLICAVCNNERSFDRTKDRKYLTAISVY